MGVKRDDVIYCRSLTLTSNSAHAAEVVVITMEVQWKGTHISNFVLCQHQKQKCYVLQFFDDAMQ
jgi:hypothetical protein